MRIENGYVVRTVFVLVLALGWAVGAYALAPESKRLILARDYIADEQWAQAIQQLRAAVNDPKETRRDEALYWLAHSLRHSGDPGEAVETISRLERDFPSSIWVKPAQSLRIEIAVRLQRNDVLWWTATAPPAPPALPVPATPPTTARVPKRGPRPVAAEPPPPAAPVAVAVPKSPPVPPPPAMWRTEAIGPDDDLRIQALGGLLRLDDAEKVVPILLQIALESETPGPAIRAVFVLAQSPSPKARATVLQVAKTASEPVRVAAVRDFARFGGENVSQDLLNVYVTAGEPVKRQIVKSLGERSEKLALLNIVNREKDGKLRSIALLWLGQAGGITQLSGMYKSATPQSKRSIIGGLFLAQAESELIRIADTEREGDAALRQEALDRLRLLGTPKAKDYLLKVSEKR
jgi:HEAT repeats